MIQNLFKLRAIRRREIETLARIVATTAGLVAPLAAFAELSNVGGMEARRLQGDAARSPLAERPTNHYLSAGVAHRF